MQGLETKAQGQALGLASKPGFVVSRAPKEPCETLGFDKTKGFGRETKNNIF